MEEKGNAKMGSLYLEHWRTEIGITQTDRNEKIGKRTLWMWVEGEDEF